MFHSDADCFEVDSRITDEEFVLDILKKTKESDFYMLVDADSFTSIKTGMIQNIISKEYQSMSPLFDIILNMNHKCAVCLIKKLGVSRQKQASWLMLFIRNIDERSDHAQKLKN